MLRRRRPGHPVVAAGDRDRRRAVALPGGGRTAAHRGRLPGTARGRPGRVVGTCVDRAATAGLEVIVLDQTRPDIELNVVKVMVPGMRHFWRRLGAGRLYDVPVRLGWRDRPAGRANSTRAASSSEQRLLPMELSWPPTPPSRPPANRRSRPCCTSARGSPARGSPSTGALPQGIAAALRELAAGDAGELELTASVLASDGPDGVLRLQLLLRRLDAAGQARARGSRGRADAGPAASGGPRPDAADHRPAARSAGQAVPVRRGPGGGRAPGRAGTALAHGWSSSPPRPAGCSARSPAGRPQQN